MCSKANATIKNLRGAKSATVKNFRVTPAIPVTRFGGKVLAHSTNSIVVSIGTLDVGIKLNSKAKKSDRLCRNGVDTATGFRRYVTSRNDSNFIAKIYTSIIFLILRRDKMSEVLQFCSAAYLRDSHASTWK